MAPSGLFRCRPSTPTFRALIVIFCFFDSRAQKFCLTENQADFLWVLNTPLKFRGGNNTPDFATGEKQTKIVSPKAEQISPFWIFFLTVFFISLSKLSKYCKKRLLVSILFSHEYASLRCCNHNSSLRVNETRYFPKNVFDPSDLRNFPWEQISFPKI